MKKEKNIAVGKVRKAPNYSDEPYVIASAMDKHKVFEIVISEGPISISSVRIDKYSDN